MTPAIRPANPHDLAQIERDLAAMLQTAKASFAARQTRKTLDTLHAAQTLATAHGFHRIASQFKRGLALLAQGRRPKLLTRPNSTLNDPDER